MTFHPAKNRSYKPVAAVLAIVLFTGVPTQAGPVVAKDVIQLLRHYQNPPDLRLRNISQNRTLDSNGFFQTPATQTGSKSSRDVLAPPGDSVLGGLKIGPDPQNIDVIAQGDVEGTVCDCGDIEIPGGGFPKWPLFLLGAIPFFFINDCENCDESPLPPTIPSPNPTPPTPTIPEPMTLILFGTGVAAFSIRYRRRLSGSQSNADTTETEDRT